MTEQYTYYLNGKLIGEAPACPKSSEIIEGFGDSAAKDIIASPTPKELGISGSLELTEEEWASLMEDINQARELSDWDSILLGGLEEEE